LNAILIISMLLWSQGGTVLRSPQERARARRTPVVDVFEANRDAVVNISSTQVVSVRPGHGGFEHFLFEIFERPRHVETTSMGSGFVIHPDGYIVTNAHVVSRTVRREVEFANGRSYEARIVAIDTQKDLAVLKIDSELSLPTVLLGRSDDLMVGETVVAIGNPFGYSHTVTSGVISATGRNIDVQEGVVFRDLIQTDASINPGNSGGPLLNILGELIGINSAIRGDAENIGFAIPVDQLIEHLPEMLNVEHLRRVRLGLLVGGGGVPRVNDVSRDSPAYEAGVRVGDVITAIDDRPVKRGTDFYFALLEKKIDEPIRLHLERNGKALAVTLAIREIPKPDGEKLAQSLFGLTLHELTDSEWRRFGLRPGNGLLVIGVHPRSPASRIGIEPGDIISSLGRYYVDSLDRAGMLLETVERGEDVPFGGLRVERNELWRITGTLTARQR